MLGSPLHLQILIHAHVSADPIANYNTAPAVREAISYLYDKGMIDREDQFCNTTEKGNYFLEHLMNIPFPETAYFIPTKE